MPENIETQAVHDKFLLFCKFGDHKNPGEMDNKTFLKMMKDCSLVTSSCTSTDVDLVFAGQKQKGSRRINFNEFQRAIAQIAKRCFRNMTEEAALLKAYDRILTSSGPSSSGTKPDAVKFHDDKSLYTGVYKNGGPTNIDKANHGLSSLLDRSDADARGVKFNN